jgi:hypothetical protein
MSRNLLTREGQQLPTVEATVRYRTVEVDGIKIFYREAGQQDAPHSSCYMGSRVRFICSGI